MIPVFQIIPAKPWHCGAMVRRLRLEHRIAVARLGLDSHRELFDRFGQSTLRRALLIDGRLEALGGVTGSALSGEGYVWLALSAKAARYPLVLVREARRQLEMAMQTRSVLVTTVLDGDEAAKRFAIFLGFVPAGDAQAMPAASRAGRRVLAATLATDPDTRVAIGSGAAVALAYRSEQQMEMS